MGFSGWVSDVCVGSVVGWGLRCLGYGGCESPAILSAGLGWVNCGSLDGLGG